MRPTRRSRPPRSATASDVERLRAMAKLSKFDKAQLFTLGAGTVSNWVWMSIGRPRLQQRQQARVRILPDLAHALATVIHRVHRPLRRTARRSRRTRCVVSPRACVRRSGPPAEVAWPALSAPPHVSTVVALDVHVHTTSRSTVDTDSAINVLNVVIERPAQVVCYPLADACGQVFLDVGA